MKWQRKQSLLKLISLHGCSDTYRCPCCGSELLTRFNDGHRAVKNPTWKVCSLYPVCKGMRFQDGSPVLNEYTIKYVTDRESLLTKDNQPFQSDTRFRNL